MRSSGERRTAHFRHARLATPELAGLELALFDLLRQLDSANGDGCVVESFESEHRLDPLFDSPVVLFDEIVQLLPRSDSHSWEVRPSPSFPAPRDAMPHRRPALSSSVCVFFIALRRKALAAFSSRFRLKKKSTVPPALFRQVGLDPAENLCVRERDASIGHHDHQSLKLSLKLVYQLTQSMIIYPSKCRPLKQHFDRNEPLHSAIIPRSGLFAPDPKLCPISVNCQEPVRHR